MITPRASNAIGWLFENAIRETSLTQADGHCRIVAHPPLSDATASTDDTVGPRRLVVLNISSYDFRIVALFDFACDGATVSHLAKTVRSEEGALQGQALDDAYAEFVNMICGSVNRGLCSQIQHSGMSTPFTLESSCARYLSLLNSEQVQHYAVTLTEEMHFRFWVCLSSAPQTTLDFDVPRTIAAEEASGELELF